MQQYFHKFKLTAHISIAYVHIMQIKYKFHDWSMLQDKADDFWQTLSYHLSSLVSTVHF